MLEAIVAAVALLTGVTFALRVTTVTPLITSISGQRIENQQAAAVDGVLTMAAETDALRRTMLFTHPENESFYNVDARNYYVDDDPPTASGEVLDKPFLGRDIAFNIYLHYLRDRRVKRVIHLVYMDEPNNHAVPRTRFAMPADDDALTKPGTSPDGDPRTVETTTTLESVAVKTDGTCFIQDEDAGPLYVVIDMEVVVWRM